MASNGYRLPPARPRGAAGARRRKVIRAARTSPWNEGKDGRNRAYPEVIDELAMRGVFDDGGWPEEGEDPDEHLDETVIAALENRQYIRDDLFGISACLYFVARYGALAVGAREMSSCRIQFALSGAEHWKGFEEAPVTLTFHKRHGARRAAARRFLEILDTNAARSEHEAYVRLVALGDGKLVL